MMFVRKTALATLFLFKTIWTHIVISMFSSPDCGLFYTVADADWRLMRIRESRYDLQQYVENMINCKRQETNQEPKHKCLIYLYFFF